jgi:murein DD-endopeptidase MepM/ murein hydrolase activator NlpD
MTALALRTRLTVFYTAVFGLLLTALALVSYRVLARQLDSDATSSLTEQTNGLHGYLRIQDGKPETTPNQSMVPETKEDYGGNHVILKIAPNVFALYVHLHTGSVAVKVGDMVKAGAPLAKIGNTGPSLGPHLHFGLSDKPNFFSGRALPFVFDSFAMVGVIDFDASEGDHVVMTLDSRQVRSAYPLYGSLVNFP